MDDQRDFLQFLIYVENANTRGPQRYLRDIENPMERLTDQQFFSRYRFSKRVFHSEIFPLVKDQLETASLRGCPKPAVVKALAVLRFYATGKYQIDAGDTHGMSQPTMCQLIKTVSLTLARMLPRFIKFPPAEELGQVGRHFYGVARFPGVVGCIDCTHVPIQNPSRDGGENFRNRKGYFSLNVQVVSGPRGEIFDIVARWPGSTHDARIFENSSIKLKFDQQQIRGLLLGDSGYGQSTYMYTPVMNPHDPAEERYNRSQTKTRGTVERLFGVWKRRFACLRRTLANKIPTVNHIITACAVLHNIAVYTREREPSDVVTEVNYDDDPPTEPIAESTRGAVIRRAFIARHFAN